MINLLSCVEADPYDGLIKLNQFLFCLLFYHCGNNGLTL